MCECDDKGFWACDAAGTCGAGNLFYERMSSESGRADDDCSSDPTPTSWDSSGGDDGGTWYCSACGDNPSGIHYIIEREECCCSGEDDCTCDSCSQETSEERVERLSVEEAWLWLVRADDNSFAQVRRLRATDFDFPEELGRLYERRSITRLLVKSERALEIVEYMAHSAVEVRPLTDEERDLYVPDEPTREEDPNQCRLTV